MARFSPAFTAAAALALTASLAACGEQEPDPAPEPTPVSSTSEAATTSAATSSKETATETTTSTRTSTSAATSTTKTSATSTTPTEKAEKLAVAEVAEKFSTLAPPELFEQLDSCSPTSMDGSYDCSGPEIGQFQFFDSESKAASTTQVLTELRSSRVVEDKGDRVVGWSVLGTSAIITVVDNNAGQVMQKLVSTDQEDPRARIYELGLAEDTGEAPAPGAPSSEQATS